MAEGINEYMIEAWSRLADAQIGPCCAMITSPLVVAELLVVELKRLGFDAIVGHSTQDVDSIAWVVLTPYEAGGGMSVFVQTGKHGYRRSFGRGWDVRQARVALLSLMGLQDGAKMQAEKILREEMK
jgi:hypothetical protein